MILAFLKPETLRNTLIILVVGCYLGYHLIRILKWWLKRTKKTKPAPAKVAAVETKIETPPIVAEPSRAPTELAPPPPIIDAPTLPSPKMALEPSPEPASEYSAEELYAKAREIPHQVIPDFDVDGEYLMLLGKSAALGYSRAMAKLGDYAMRRAAWVEAYYWMWMAKRHGMQNLNQVLLEIRRNWAAEGYPLQSSNANAIFTLEAGSIGRALLDHDSGCDTASAREFLKGIL